MSQSINDKIGQNWSDLGQEICFRKIVSYNKK